MTCERVKFGTSGYAIMCSRGTHRKTWDCECKHRNKAAVVVCEKCGLYRDGCPICDADMKPTGAAGEHKCEKCGHTINVGPKAQPQLKHIERQYKERRVRFVRGWRDITALDLLAACVEHNVQIIYLVGGWDAASTPRRDWFQAPVAAGEWSITAYMDDHATSVNYQRGAIKISFRMSSIWFGRCADVDEMASAYATIGVQLKLKFDKNAILLGTPAATGADLLQRSIPWDETYSVLPDEVREIFYHNVPQGRVEMLTPAETTTIPAFYHLDARWMYAACCRDLPGRLKKIDHDPTFLGAYEPVFYRVAVYVPSDWDHIGLLPWFDADANATRYPSAPCASFVTWASAAEIGIAIQQRWEIAILERVIFERADPARAWITKLRDMRAATDNKLLQDAIRHLCIDTIGSWHRKDTPIRHLTPLSEAATVTNAISQQVTPAGIEWYSAGQLARSQQSYMHPEWSATVWGRARARLVRAALQMPRKSLIALRTDAISATMNPGWPDEGKPGDWRPKIAYVGELPAPHTVDAYLRLRAQLEVMRDGRQ